MITALREVNIFSKPLSRTASILIALLVTFFWSTSFIIIKWGLRDIPPLTFAGLRYFLAFICLFPFMLTKEKLSEVKNIDRKDWFRLTVLGVLFYTLTQGTQFIGLSLLPAVTVSLILNFTPIIVAVMGIFLLSERPSILQWLGACLFIVGILTYFYPVDLSGSKTLGIIVMTIGVFSNAFSSVLGRGINRSHKFHPLMVTVISMGIGSIIMLIVGLTTQGLPPLSLTNVLFLLWLSIVNTAFAFTLWNLSLQTLTAMESSIINGTMLIQIAFLAWIFIGEPVTWREGIGMFVAATGAIVVQIKRRN